MTQEKETKSKNWLLAINLAQKIESLLENKDAYGSNIELLSFSIAKNATVKGKFRDLWNKRIFTYSIENNRFGYSPAIKGNGENTLTQDSKRFDNFSHGYNAVLPAIRLDRINNKKPRCTSVSFSCGQICLNLNKTCWVNDRGNFDKAYQKEFSNIQVLVKEIANQGITNWSKYDSSSLTISSTPLSAKTNKKSLVAPAFKGLNKELNKMFDSGYTELTKYNIYDLLQKLKKEPTGEEVVNYLNNLQSLTANKIKDLVKRKESVDKKTKEIEKTNGDKDALEFYEENWNQDIETLIDNPTKVLNEIGRQFLRNRTPSKLKTTDLGRLTANPIRHGIPIRIGDIDTRTLRNITSGVDIFKEMVGVNTLDDKTVGIAGAEGRSFYDNSSIHIRENSPPEITVHELAHWLEDSDPIIHKKIQLFFEKRTVGESWQSLRTLTGNEGYGRDEVAKPDKWLHPYMGKKTGIGNSEILSMGMEMMYKAPVDFAKADPEYFAFIYDTLRGK